MTSRALPIDPALGSLSRAAVELLGKRNVLDADSADFAKNRHFRRLHGGNLDGPEKPIVLFTACPHDLLDHGGGGGAVPDYVARWVVPPPPVTVDGQAIPLLGTDCAAARPMSWDDRAAAARSVLAVERGSPAPYGGDILLYRELHPSGFCEWGASGLFFGRNSRACTGLRLCHMVGEFRVFLESLAPLYAKMNMDRPFIAFLSIRNSSRLVLDTYGDEELDRPWDDTTRRPAARLDPATSCANIQSWHDFASAGAAAGGAAARAAADAAARVCSAYSEADPGCGRIGGAFYWGQWRRARENALGRYRLRPGAAGPRDGATRCGAKRSRAGTGGEPLA